MLTVALVTEVRLPPVTLALRLSRAAAAAGTAVEEIAAEDADVQLPIVVVVPAHVPNAWFHDAPTQAVRVTDVVPPTPPTTTTL
jgi:hypothetical protein